MPWSESLPQFSLAGTLLTVLLLFFAAFGEPLLGRRAFAWLSRRGNGDERALGLLYAVTMAIHVLWGLLVLAVLLLSPDLNAVDLGLRVPDAVGPVVGAAIGGTIALAAFWVLVNGLPARPARRPRRGTGDGDAESGGRGRKGHRGRRGASRPMRLPEPGSQQYLLLPRTGRERALAGGMAVTGGVFGELLYRGLFITLIASMDVPLWIAAVMSVVLFSLAHLYQGWWGLLSAGFSGTLFTVLYLGTGSLVVPIAVHVALNLRSVVFPPAAERAAAEESLRAEDGDDEYPDEEYYDDEGEDRYADDGYGRTGEFEAVDAGETAPAETAYADAAHAYGSPSPDLPSHGSSEEQRYRGRPSPGFGEGGPVSHDPPPGPGYRGSPAPGPHGTGTPAFGTPAFDTPPPQGPPPGYGQRPPHSPPPHPPQGYSGPHPGHGTGDDTRGPHSPYRD
ncbi:CPBP family intramembrane glutamic endopeptidase [Nocardiopsis sp. NPDC006938]|uniref:CPBP family intramembrane glutamic endopeptidase n=1 Tax=Nocardiopsis sp. NPDC006938 TaxID=3364337 RepID=UPI0036837698